jgi:hypothetical protein
MTLAYFRRPIFPRLAITLSPHDPKYEVCYSVYAGLNPYIDMQLTCPVNLKAATIAQWCNLRKTGSRLNLLPFVWYTLSGFDFALFRFRSRFSRLEKGENGTSTRTTSCGNTLFFP